MLIKDLLNTIQKDRNYIDIEIYKENHSEPITSFLLSWLDSKDKKVYSPTGLKDIDLYLPEDLANSSVKEIRVIQQIDEDEDFDGVWVYDNGNLLFQITIQE